MNPLSAIDVASTIVNGVELASTVKTKKIKYIWNRYFRRTIRVIVYGDSGVGKTQFLNTLTGRNTYTPDRTRFVSKFELTLSSGRKIEFLDTPGHQSSKIARLHALDYIAKGKVDGIINLVDYGYQDGEEMEKQLETAFNVDTNQVKDSFLRENRLLELNRTKEFLDRINPNTRVGWIITVVNKADVWYSNINEILEYYKEGEYGKELKQYSHTVHLDTLPFCSVITPYANRKMLLEFSERDKIRFYNSLLEEFEQLISIGR